MAKVLIIGSGAVATVGIQKCAQNHAIFNEIIVASRTKSKIETIIKRCEKYPVKMSAETIDAVSPISAYDRLMLIERPARTRTRRGFLQIGYLCIYWLICGGLAAGDFSMKKAGKRILIRPRW